MAESKSSDDIYFWVFVLICVVAILLFVDLNKKTKERFDGIYRLDPTDLANPDPRNSYVTLNAMTEAEKNFDPNLGPYML